MNTELEVLTLCKRDIARWRESPRNLTEMQLMSYFCIQAYSCLMYRDAESQRM
uniref:AlNc14C217G9036 protein n=1 Tax=Albugo laibachii Nc14 TaxID=890382 RepID=F0WRN9_9STRA|nr:AlNc14C217G9036 [Albugo laibachii Nc14]|eukprot:CCA24003.1 AlNc14C217G9036 [Albugo laibachii Nc14]